MIIPSIDTYREFSGSAEELARLGTLVCNSLGLSKDGDEELSVRLVRDYAQRDILSRPERQGKEAVYSWRHLIELVAARALLADGWPLAKITEHFALTPHDGLLALIPGQPQEASALATARRIREQTRSRPAFRYESARMPMQSAPPPGDFFAGSVPERPSQQFASRTSRRAELDAAMHQLTGGDTRPRVALMTRISLDDDIQLLVSNDRLRNLSQEGADAIGRAVSAAIIDWLTTKGSKQS
jgi:DNA-binding transcriptional MerR regulator